MVALERGYLLLCSVVATLALGSHTYAALLSVASKSTTDTRAGIILHYGIPRYGGRGRGYRREKMMCPRLKLFALTVGAAALFATPSLARVAPTSSDTVFRPDGKIVGADPDLNIRFQLLRDEFANEQ
jgi:hypothetical protein